MLERLFPARTPKIDKGAAEFSPALLDRAWANLIDAENPRKQELGREYAQKILRQWKARIRSVAVVSGLDPRAIGRLSGSSVELSDGRVATVGGSPDRSNGFWMRFITPHPCLHEDLMRFYASKGGEYLLIRSGIGEHLEASRIPPLQYEAYLHDARLTSMIQVATEVREGRFVVTPRMIEF